MTMAPCPRCDSGSVPIAYGYPTEAAMERARRGEIVLGGCVIADENFHLHLRILL